MINETESAVKCLRTRFTGPSYASPFLEPYLPLYDSIRDEPEFIELMDEIKAGRYHSPGITEKPTRQ